jgi:hypothetical protein
MHPALKQDESFAQMLARISNPPTPTLDKFAQVAADLRRELAAEEEAHREVVFQDSHDKYWESRCASHEDGDEGEFA